MAINYLKTAKFKNKTVVLRVDVNEPIKDGKLDDDFRIQQVIPTVQELLNRGCKIVICGHLGRPAGKFDKAFSMRPIAERFAELMGRKFIETSHALTKYPINHVIFFTGNISELKARQQIETISQKDIVFLENLRFYRGEEENSAYFAKQLAELGEVYVNDAFAVSHHKAASISAITKYLPSYAGFVIEKEVRSLNFVLQKPKHPFVLMMGGMKISEKEQTLQYVGERADSILLAGGLANLMFLAHGFEIGLSPIEVKGKKSAWQILKNFKDRIFLPVDLVVANKNMDKKSIRVTPATGVRKNEIIYDIGPKTILEFSKKIKVAKTLVWNGPLGKFEHRPFDTSTMALARVVGGVSKGKCYAAVGGGETVDAIRLAGQADYIDHLSTGGGAMLEFLAGKKLPGIQALEK